MAKPKIKKPKISDKVTPDQMNGVTVGDISGAPYVDKFPRVIGSRLTLNEVSSIVKQSVFGNRCEYVDLLDELVKKDSSAYACLMQRILSVVSAEFTIREAEYVSNKDKPRAERVANFVRRKIAGIHGLKRSLQELQWAIFLGITGQEISWKTDSEGYIVPNNLNLIHSRRLEYPEQNTWNLYIMDKGMMPDKDNPYYYGIRAASYPGKFVIHTPGLRGGYPTNDGLGHQLVICMTLKAMALRSGAQTIERFAKPWAIAYYNTKSEENKGNPRVATTNGPNSDVAKAELALQALGTGAMTYATLPDSVSLQPQENLTGSFTAELPQTIFIKYLDQQIARAVLTTDEFTIAAGVGSQAKAEVLKRNLMQVLQYDAELLANTLTEQLIHYLVLYNFPEDIDFVPKLIMQVQDAPNLEQLVLAAEQAFALGADINIQKLCDAWDIPLTDDPALIAKGRASPDEQLKADTQVKTADKAIKSKEKAASKSKKSVASNAKLCYLLSEYETIYE